MKKAVKGFFGSISSVLLVLDWVAKSAKCEAGIDALGVSSSVLENTLDKAAILHCPTKDVLVSDI